MTFFRAMKEGVKVSTRMGAFGKKKGLNCSLRVGKRGKERLGFLRKRNLHDDIIKVRNHH